MVRRCFWAGLLALGALTGCASAPTASRNALASACFDLRYAHEMTLRAHVDYSGYTPELSARVAERFVKGIDPYQVLLSDDERALFRAAALATSPTAGPEGCRALIGAAKLLETLAPKLRGVVDDALALPDAVGELRTIDLPKLPHGTPSQRDVALSRAVRHFRQVLHAAGTEKLRSSILARMWFDEQLERLTDPVQTLEAFNDAFLRSLPGDNAILRNAVTQLEAKGIGDPLLRAVRPDWVPEIVAPDALGLGQRAPDARAGDRVVGMVIETKDRPALLYPWVGESPLDWRHLRPVAPLERVRYHLVGLRQDASGVWRPLEFGPSRFGPAFETVDTPAGKILWMSVDALEAEVATRFPQEIAEHAPKAVVVDLRLASSPTEVLPDAFVGLFLQDTRWGLVEGRGQRIEERRSIGLKPAWNGPTVVLVGPNTRGVAETFASGLQRTGRAVVVGAAPTRGTTGAVLQTKIDSGRELLLTFGKRFGPDGKTLEGVGVSPDVSVEAPAPLVTPRFGFGEKLVAKLPESAKALTVSVRGLASSKLPALRRAAAARAKKAADGDRAAAAALAVAEALLREGNVR